MAIVMAWEPRHPGPDRDALPCPQGPGPGGSTRWHSQHAVWGSMELSHASRDVYTLGPQNPAGVLPAAQCHCLRKDVPSLQPGEQSMGCIYPWSVHGLHTCVQQPWHCPQPVPTSLRLSSASSVPLGHGLPQPPSQVARLVLG